MESFTEFAVAGIVIASILFLVLRAFWLWYWRISEIVNLLKSIDKRLAKMSNDEIEIETESISAPYLEKDGIRLSRRPS